VFARLSVMSRNDPDIPQVTESPESFFRALDTIQASAFLDRRKCSAAGLGRLTGSRLDRSVRYLK